MAGGGKDFYFGSWKLHGASGVKQRDHIKERESRPGVIFIGFEDGGLGFPKAYSSLVNLK